MRISSFDLLKVFLHTGLTAIGSSYAAIEPLRRHVVEEKGWMDADTFGQCLTLTQAMPGIFGLNLASYVGHRLAGWRGSVLAVLGMLAAPLALVAVVSPFVGDLRSSAWLASFLKGTAPAIVALILLPVLGMLNKETLSLSTIWIPVGAAVAIALMGISPTYIIAGLVFMALLYALLMHPDE